MIHKVELPIETQGAVAESLVAIELVGEVLQQMFAILRPVGAILFVFHDVIARKPSLGGDMAVYDELRIVLQSLVRIGYLTDQLLEIQLCIHVLRFVCL